MDWFVNSKVRSRFSSVEVLGMEGLQLDKAILLIGNHSTWWDGFWGWYLNRHYFRKQYYVMMLEDQLKKFWFFAKCGAFSIQPGSRTVATSLKYARTLLSDKRTFMQFYPQGRLYSLYDSEIEFKPGLEWILKGNADVLVVFYAVFVDYGASEIPYAAFYLKAQEHDHRVEELQEAYRNFYLESKKIHCQRFKP